MDHETYRLYKSMRSLPSIANRTRFTTEAHCGTKNRKAVMAPLRRFQAEWSNRYYFDNALMGIEGTCPGGTGQLFCFDIKNGTTIEFVAFVYRINYGETSDYRLSTYTYEQAHQPIDHSTIQQMEACFLYKLVQRGFAKDTGNDCKLLIES